MRSKQLVCVVSGLDTNHTRILGELSVDAADSIVVNEFEMRMDRTFGNNYVHGAIIIDHTVYRKYGGDDAYIVRLYLSIFNMVSC